MRPAELPVVEIRGVPVHAVTERETIRVILDELAAGTHDQVATLLYLNLGLPKLEAAKSEAAKPEPGH